jgi:hypothetical protein
MRLLADQPIQRQAKLKNLTNQGDWSGLVSGNWQKVFK